MASSDWERVPLAQVLTQIFDEVKVKDGVAYKQVTVRMHNKGLTLRQEVGGQEIRTKRQFRVREGQFVFSRIDARNGAMGLVPHELDGAIVSNDFPVFDIRNDRVDSDFFKYFVSTAPFLDACLAQSKGTSNRRRLKEPDFLEIPIALPSLDEQQRIVARIDALAGRIAEAQILQAEAVGGTEGFYASERFKVFQKESANCAQEMKLDDVADIKMGQSPKGNTYNDTGNGVPLLNGPTEFGGHHPTEKQWTTTPTKLCKAGDILLCVRGATTGRLNWADKQYCIGRGLAALTANEEICLPQYVYKFVEIQTQVMLEVAVGTTFPNLSGDKLKSLKIPVPQLDEQRRIVAHLDQVQERVNALKQLQEKSQAELDALLPSVLDKAFRGEL